MILVKGYTDNILIGPGLISQGITSNLALSQKRADTVMQFLIAQGVEPSLVSAQGFGEADPVASNDTPEGRAQNRRVELTLAGAGNGRCCRRGLEYRLQPVLGGRPAEAGTPTPSGSAPAIMTVAFADE